jgi:hypothetical protein
MTVYSIEMKNGVSPDKIILKNVTWDEVLVYLGSVDPKLTLHKFPEPYLEIKESKERA